MSELLNGDGLRSAAYLIAAGLAALAAVRARADGEYAPIAFWCVASAVLLLFGTASYIDITSLVGGDVRGLVAEWGWYGERREVQERTIVSVIFGAVMVGAAVFVIGRPGVVSAGVVVLTALVAFVAVRSASLHRVDAWIRRDAWSGVELGAMVEFALTGVLATVAVAALAVQFDARRRQGRKRMLENVKIR